MKFSIRGHKIEVNIRSWAALDAAVAERLAERRGFALATINLDHIVKLRSSASFMEAYAQQDLICADGNPIVWMSHLAGQPVQLIPGSDAIEPLARVAARMGVPIAMVGSTPESLAGARDHLMNEIPGLEVACMISPPMGFDAGGDAGRDVLRQVAASGARLVFIAMGAPRQELFAALGREVAPELGFVSIGAGLDFFSGMQQRAPEWVRRYALEWMWRMVSNPKRLGARYLKCFAILPGQMLAALAMRLSDSGRGESQLEG